MSDSCAHDIHLSGMNQSYYIRAPMVNEGCTVKAFFMHVCCSPRKAYSEIMPSFGVVLYTVGLEN